MPPCPRCQSTKFNPIPDSLANACDNCGFVWVGSNGKYEAGATIGEWLEDVYNIPNTLDQKWKGKTDCQGI